MIDLDSLADTELAALSPRERSLASALLDTAAQWMPQSVRDARVRAARERRDRFVDPLRALGRFLACTVLHGMRSNTPTTCQIYTTFSAEIPHTTSRFHPFS